jgi:hypothetical protein
MIGSTLAVALLTALSAEANDQAQEGKDYALFEIPRLRCVIGNNAALGEHRAWYNGVFSMSAPECETTPFVPLYAGLNLENFFDGARASDDREIFFEPRAAAMEFRRINDRTAELYQPATPVYGIESWTRFELKEPYYIDLSFRCVPHKPDLAGGFFGVFWASYINGPENKSYYFLAPGSTLDAPVWVQFLTQQHDRDSTVRSAEGGADVPLNRDKKCLWTEISPLRYGAPFFYGRFQNMVLIYIFEPNPNIRFAHSPSGGGETPAKDGHNPAWDFQLIVPDYKVGQEYPLHMRLVYKPWVDRADVLQEVRRYLDEHGNG